MSTTSPHDLANADAREALLLAAICHVLRYGKVGKQSKARLQGAVRAVSLGRMHRV